MTNFNLVLSTCVQEDLRHPEECTHTDVLRNEALFNCYKNYLQNACMYCIRTAQRVSCARRPRYKHFLHIVET